MAARQATPDDLPAEFDNVDSREIAYALDVAWLVVSIEAYGDTTSQQHALLTAHVLKRLGLGSNRSTSLSPNRIQVGSVSRSSAASFTAGDDLNLTEYGKRFQGYSAAVFPGPMAI